MWTQSVWHVVYGCVVHVEPFWRHCFHHHHHIRQAPYFRPPPKTF